MWASQEQELCLCCLSLFLWCLEDPQILNKYEHSQGINHTNLMLKHIL